MKHAAVHAVTLVLGLALGLNLALGPHGLARAGSAESAGLPLISAGGDSPSRYSIVGATSARVPARPISAGRPT